MREIRVGQPRLERLSGAETLLDEPERGEIGLAEARERLGALGRSPGVRRRYARLAILVSVTGWVLFLNGTGAMTVLVAVLASLLTFPVGVVVDRLRCRRRRRCSCQR